MPQDKETSTEEKPPADFEETVRLFEWKLTEEERLRERVERECWW